MKPLLFALLLFCSSFIAVAQVQPDSSTAKPRRFYIGAQFSTASYMPMSEQPLMSGSVQPLGFLNVGYKLNKRTVLQMGIGYGSNEWDAGSIYYKSADSTIYETDYQRTRGVAIPVTVRFTPFNPNRRLQLYATASIIPVFGSIKKYVASEMDGVETVAYDAEVSVSDVFATAGLMLNYKVSKRLDGYIEGNLYYKSFADYYSLYEASKPKSFGVGLNYNFNLKRGK